jgi:heme exporter protein B
MTAALWAILVRDLRIATRARGGGLTAVLFFLVLIAMAPLALGPDLALLRRIGPALLWLGALLSSLLALDHLFLEDLEDGSLDLILLARAPLELIVAARALAHWIATGLPLVIAAPLLGLLLDVEPAAGLKVAVTLLAGTLALTFIGLVSAAIAVSLRRGGLLLPILVLPLSTPVLIFGVSASMSGVDGAVPFAAPFTILCALTLVGLVVGPIGAAAALRHGTE